MQTAPESSWGVGGAVGSCGSPLHNTEADEAPDKRRLLD